MHLEFFFIVLAKLVRGGDVLVQLKDDFVFYEIHRNGQLTGGPYKPE